MQDHLIAAKDLPEWDLSNLYSSIKDPQIEEDLKLFKNLSGDFTIKYENLFKNHKWQPSDLLNAIKEYEAIQEIGGKLVSFAGLMYYKNLKNPEIGQFYQQVQEQATNLSAALVFFTLDINKINDALIEKALDESLELKRYKPWLDKVRLFKEYQLSSDLEKLFLEKSLTSSQALVRLYDETLAGLKFDFDGKVLNISAVVDLISNPDRQIRQKAAGVLHDVLSANASIFTFITNTLAKDKEIEDNWRKLETPMQSRHLQNQVKAEVIDALEHAVKQKLPALSHRYYKLKAKIMGLDYLEYWDRNAPLASESEQSISWVKAREIVLNAYKDFSPQMQTIGLKFFDNNWIDVPMQDGKTSGAFAHPTVPSCNPYLLLNYQGKNRDVMTLAHELGHGIHQVLASAHGALLCDTPLTLAETASVFGEMLVFQYLLKSEDDKLKKRQLLSGKIDDMINTTVRQMAFYEFEKQIHHKRKANELSTAQIGDIWLDVQRQFLGDGVRVDSTSSSYWAYISHFIHTPFYVYAYAFGDCLVNSLYVVYEAEPNGFEQKYIELLKAGGTKGYKELLQPFGIDPHNPNFWSQGLDMISHLINELEMLID